MNDDMTEIVKLAPETAKAMLKVQDGYVHAVATPITNMLIGADWSENDAHEAIDTGESQLAGPAATGMKHGLAVKLKSGDLVFFETA